MIYSAVFEKLSLWWNESLHPDFGFIFQFSVMPFNFFLFFFSE